jgi:hypothetical protein
MTAKSSRQHFDTYSKLAFVLIQTEAHTATKYLSPTHVVRATRIVWRGKIDKRSRTIEIRFTDGKPNYHAREFIKRCQKAGEPFPVRKIQLKFFPKQKGK